MVNIQLSNGIFMGNIWRAESNCLGEAIPKKNRTAVNYPKCMPNGILVV